MNIPIPGKDALRLSIHTQRGMKPIIIPGTLTPCGHSHFMKEKGPPGRPGDEVGNMIFIGFIVCERNKRNYYIYSFKKSPDEG